jgi:hypothetical protein
VNINLKAGVTGPTFLVIGAQKCGTTWLSDMICQHPEVAKVANKELHFFNRTSNYSKGVEWYQKQFDIKEYTQAVGEYTPNYFWTYNDMIQYDTEIWEDIPKLIHTYNPDLKLIVILRDPVKRAISAFYQHIRKGRISPKENLQDAMKKYGILSMGYYDIHIKNWLKFFPIENFLILIYENDLLDENKINTIKRVFRHIGVSDNFLPTGIYDKKNPSGSFLEIRSQYYFSKFGKLLCLFIPGVIKRLKYWDIKISDQEKTILNDIYAIHNLELSKVLSRKLPW